MSRPIDERAVSEHAKIAAFEMKYWQEVDDSTHDSMLISIGAMGAAANICGAIAMGVTAEEYEKQCKERSRRKV